MGWFLGGLRYGEFLLQVLLYVVIAQWRCGVLGCSALDWHNVGAEGLFLSNDRVLRCEVLLLGLYTTGCLSRGVLPNSLRLLLWQIRQLHVFSLGDQRSIRCLYVWLHSIRSMLRLWRVLGDHLVVSCELFCFAQEFWWVLLPPGCNWCCPMFQGRLRKAWLMLRPIEP